MFTYNICEINPYLQNNSFVSQRISCFPNQKRGQLPTSKCLTHLVQRCLIYLYHVEVSFLNISHKVTQTSSPLQSIFNFLRIVKINIFSASYIFPAVISSVELLLEQSGFPWRRRKIYKLLCM